jgi:hypothetical protein
MSDPAIADYTLSTFYLIFGSHVVHDLHLLNQGTDHWQRCLDLHAFDVTAATVFNFANYAKEAVSELA